MLLHHLIYEQVDKGNAKQYAIFLDFTFYSIEGDRFWAMLQKLGIDKRLLDASEYYSQNQNTILSNWSIMEM